MKTAVTNQPSAGSSGSQSQGSDSGGEDSSKENKDTSSNNGDGPGTPRRSRGIRSKYLFVNKYLLLIILYPGTAGLSLEKNGNLQVTARQHFESKEQNNFV